jgi:hypothetical protein
LSSWIDGRRIVIGHCRFKRTRYADFRHRCFEGGEKVEIEKRNQIYSVRDYATEELLMKFNKSMVNFTDSGGLQYDRNGPYGSIRERLVRQLRV